MTITRMVPIAVSDPDPDGDGRLGGGWSGDSRDRYRRKAECSRPVAGDILPIDLQGLDAPEVVGAVVQGLLILIGGSCGRGGHHHLLELRILGDVDLILSSILPGAPGEGERFCLAGLAAVVRA